MGEPFPFDKDEPMRGAEIQREPAAVEQAVPEGVKRKGKRGWKKWAWVLYVVGFGVLLICLKDVEVDGVPAPYVGYGLIVFGVIGGVWRMLKGGEEE